MTNTTNSLAVQPFFAVDGRTLKYRNRIRAAVFACKFKPRILKEVTPRLVGQGWEDWYSCGTGYCSVKVL